MKNILRKYQLHAALVMGFFACSSCEKIIDITIPERERKIVVNGLITRDESVRVHLSRSLSVLERDSLISISGGIVRLFHGNDLLGTLQEESGGYYSLPGFNPEVGETYRMTAEYNNLASVEASATLPPLVSIISVDTTTMIGEWGQQELRISVKFNDPGGVKNAYGFGLDITYKEFDYNTMAYTGKMLKHPAWISGDNDRFLKDESINLDGKVYFQDLLFDGMQKSVEFGIWDYAFFESDTVWLDVKIMQIDPSYYKYVVSNNEYQEAQGNPFAEPVQVYTNVKGGFGIFAGSSTSTYPVIIRGMRKFE